MVMLHKKLMNTQRECATIAVIAVFLYPATLKQDHAVWNEQSHTQDSFTAHIKFGRGTNQTMGAHVMRVESQCKSCGYLNFLKSHWELLNYLMQGCIHKD